MAQACLDRQVRAAYERLEALKQGLAGLPATQQGTAAKALEELSAALRDISVAAESDRQRDQELFDSAPDGYLVTDGEGIIQDANRAAAALLHASHDLLLGSPLSMFVDERDRPSFSGELAQLEGADAAQELEVRLKPGGLEPFPAVLSVGPARDPDGGLRWLLRDISKQKGAEETLQRSYDALAGRVKEDAADLAEAGAALQTEIDQHQRTDAALAEQQAALAAVYRIATSTNRSSEAACDQVVLSLTQLLNVPCAAVRKAERRGLAMVSMAVDGSLSHDGVASGECGPCGMVCREGAPHQCDGPLRQRFPDSQCFSDHDFRAYVGIPMKNSEGQVTGVLCAMDYRDRVFRESDVYLMEIFAQYVANVLERDAIERQLLESERFQLLGQLTSGVAHEVRNPINAILIMTEALEARLGDGSEHAHYLGRIRAQVDRLSALMQDLLDLAKPLQLSRLERQSLAAICDAAAELWRQSTPDAKQAVRVVVPPGLFCVEVVADVARLTQVFINLIDNAAQHSPDDGEILLSVLPRDGDVARAQVIDRGCGIPADNLARVSSPFFTTRKNGTGLGLSLVKHMVEAHQGDVAIWNNDPAPGCTVEVRLPVAEEASP